MGEIEEKLLQVLVKIEKELEKKIDPPNDLLTIDQLAERWQVGKTLINDMKAKKLIPFIYVGSNVRFPLNEIKLWEKRNTHKDYAS